MIPGTTNVTDQDEIQITTLNKTDHVETETNISMEIEQEEIQTGNGTGIVQEEVQMLKQSKRNPINPLHQVEIVSRKRKIQIQQSPR